MKNNNNNRYPFVSVILPIRNEKCYIGKCLQFITNQNYSNGNFEVLVVDGISNDETRKIIKKYCKQNSL